MLTSGSLQKHQKTITHEVKSSDTIKTVKSKIKVTPPNPQHLISAAEYGRMGILLQLHQEHAVLLVPCLCGGMNEPSLHQLTPKCSHDNMLPCKCSPASCI